MAATGKEAVTLEQLKRQIDALPSGESVTYTLTKSGSTITLNGSDGSKTSVQDENTTYGLASASSNGLMSSSQYTKLSNLPSSFSAPTFKTLYSNTAGTTSATLSDYVSNYRMIVVIFKDSSNRLFSSISYPNHSTSGGTLVGTRGVYSSSVKGYYTTSTLCSIKGKSATLSGTGQGYSGADNSADADATADLLITSVIGIDW